jgi:hypothetical protein
MSPFTPDKEYEEDTDICEEYIDKAKVAIQKASRRTDNSPICIGSTIEPGWTDPACCNNSGC